MYLTSPGEVRSNCPGIHVSFLGAGTKLVIDQAEYGGTYYANVHDLIILVVYEARSATSIGVQ